MTCWRCWGWGTVGVGSGWTSSTGTVSGGVIGRGSVFAVDSDFTPTWGNVSSNPGTPDAASFSRVDPTWDDDPLPTGLEADSGI